MQRKFWFLVLLVAALLSAGAVAADDGFYVIAGSRGVGTAITSVPLTISKPGFYYLAATFTDLNSGITVNTDNVTIDLMGFSLYAISVWTSGAAVNINGHQNVEVRNGGLYGWSSGVDDNGSGAHNRAINLRIQECLSYGVRFGGSGGGNQVKGCIIDNPSVGATGIYVKGGLVSGNTVTSCDVGISGHGTISGNWVTNCTYGQPYVSSAYGISCDDASSIIGNTVVNNNSSQFGIYIGTSNQVIVTQNAASGPGTHFQSGGNATVSVNNAF